MVSLARSIAASSLSAENMERTGPKISSLAIRLVGSTWLNTVGVT